MRSNRIEPTSILKSEAGIVSDDEHHADEGFPKVFKKSDKEDQLSDIALRLHIVKSYIQLQNSVEEIGTKPFFFLPPRPGFFKRARI